MGAKTVEQAKEIQNSYARRAYEQYFQEVNKIGTIDASIAKDAMKPMERMTQSGLGPLVHQSGCNEKLAPGSPPGLFLAYFPGPTPPIISFPVTDDRSRGRVQGTCARRRGYVWSERRTLRARREAELGVGLAGARL